MDLETTGLPAPGVKTKITELSLVGVLTNHILDSHNSNSQETPRVLQKLSLCFYPQKRVDMVATEVTGLDNFLLEEIPIFNEQACELVTAFLKRMPQPVVLIAHNGMKFDFPILKAEFSAKGNALPEDLLCADSLEAFRYLFPISDHCGVSPLVGGIPRTESGETCQVVSDVSVENSSSHKRIDFSMTDVQKMNETTPKTLKGPVCPPPLKRKCGDNGEKNGTARKRLFLGQEFPRSHKLGDIYQYLVGKAQDGGHRAESDTMALLQCVVSAAPQFLLWIEENNVGFSRIPCMW